MEDVENPNCLFIRNPPDDEQRDPPAWDTTNCCLRARVGRFPPYLEFAGVPLYPDYDAEVYHMCGSVVESVISLLHVVNCSCLVNAPFVAPDKDSGLMESIDSFDLRLLADYSYTHHSQVGKMEQHYPLGSISVSSILGREKALPAPGIRILALYRPAVWVGFCCSLISISVILSLAVYLDWHIQRNLSAKLFHKRSNGEPSFLVLLPVNFLNVFGIYWGQHLGRQSTTAGFKKTQVTTSILVGWSLVSTFILTKAATSDLLEILLHQGGTDRFSSTADLISRTTIGSGINENFLVAYFWGSYLHTAVGSGSVKLACRTQNIINDEEVSYKVVELLEPLKESAAVIVGAVATLTYIVNGYVTVVGCQECGTILYVQEDATHSVPYYMKTPLHSWSPDKLKDWRLATGHLLESGLSDFYYRRELRQRLPDFVRKQDLEDQKRSFDDLKSVVIGLHSVWTILLVCVLIGMFGAVIMLWEVNLHSAHQIQGIEVTGYQRSKISSKMRPT